MGYLTGVKYESKPHYSFQHTLADIVMGAIQTGLTLRHFAEFGYDISNFCGDLEHAKATPPMGMTLVWQERG